MTELPAEPRDYCTNHFLVKIFYEFDYDLKKFLLAVRRTDEVDWEKIQNKLYLHP